MKNTKQLKCILLIALLSVIVLPLCSCSLKKEEETATTAFVTTAYAPAFGPTSETQSTSETVSETQSETSLTQAENVTQPYEQATEPVTSYQPADYQTQPAAPVTETGTKTVTDGSKTIVYPAKLESSNEKYPVISWANGTGCPTQSYLALLGELANGGYIVVADSDVMTAQGKTQIDSINYIINKNSDSSSVFYNKVNTAAIGVCGHSQGGRSCINAAQTDKRIKCVVSIAGASSKEEANGLTTPALFLTGTGDLVVVSSQWCKPSYDAVSGRAAYASLKGGIHTTCMTNPKKISGYTLNWFDAFLKNDAAARAVFDNGGAFANDANWQDFQTKN